MKTGSNSFPLVPLSGWCLQRWRQALYLLLVMGSLLSAQPVEPASAPLDLVPEDAAAALVVRNLHELSQRGDHLIQQNGLRIEHRVSDAFPLLLNWLKLDEGVDTNGTFALILGHPDLAEEPGDFLGTLVLVVPLMDAAHTRAHPPMPAGLKFQVHKKHLYVGFSEQVLRGVIQSPPLSDRLPPGRERHLAGADLLLHLGPRIWAETWENMEAELDTHLQVDDPDMKPVAAQVRDVFRQMVIVLGTVHLEEGIRVGLTPLFDPEKEPAVRELLGRLRGGDAVTQVDALPPGDPVAVLSVKGRGEVNFLLARAIFHLMVAGLPDSNPMQDLNLPLVLDRVSPIWKRLHGTQGGLYRNADPQTAGHLSMVYVFETPSTDELLGEIRKLINAGNEGYSYTSGVMRLSGQPVHRLGIPVADIRADARQSFAWAFGPDWQQFHLAVEDERLVVLVGSDLALMKATLDHLQQGRPGHDSFAELRQARERLSFERKLEIHGCFRELAQLAQALESKPEREPLPKAGKQAFSSIGWSIDADGIKLELLMPGEEVRWAEWLLNF